jgi:hypothetical protein
MSAKIILINLVVISLIGFSVEQSLIIPSYRYVGAYSELLKKSCWKISINLIIYLGSNTYYISENMKVPNCCFIYDQLFSFFVLDFIVWIPFSGNVDATRAVAIV